VDFPVLTLVALMGLVIGALISALWFAQRRSANTGDTTSPVVELDGEDAVSIAQLLAVLPGASMLVDGSNGAVQRATARAVSLGLVVSDRISSVDLRSLIGEVYRDGITREHDIVIRRPSLARGALDLRARAALLGGNTVLVLVEDQSGARRVDTVRRDFVANVSHELKTPVGALQLLAEAVAGAADDPEAVQRFAERMQAESLRLTRLVADLIDLSQLQGDQPLDSAAPVSVDEVIEEAVDAVRTAAQTQEIDIVVGGTTDLLVYGVEDQLITAVRNLLANAISYSQPRTKVAIGVGARDQIVNISVTDQGIGIEGEDLERIFERFYRVDQARSRITGGTGLGLSIVKHICQNHGGEVTVWSVPGEGSTFTLRLPEYRSERGEETAEQEPPEVGLEPRPVAPSDTELRS
jgi:two-component system, OmpR family, sensor histidine kinase SenX3